MNFFDFFKKQLKPKFKIGETVRCIDDRDHGDIKYGIKYKILDCIICYGIVAYDVGLRFNDTNTHTALNGDGKYPFPGAGIHWAGEFRFAGSISDEEENSEENEKEKTNTIKLVPNKEVLKNEEILEN